MKLIAILFMLVGVVYSKYLPIGAKCPLNKAVYSDLEVICGEADWTDSLSWRIGLSKFPPNEVVIGYKHLDVYIEDISTQFKLTPTKVNKGINSYYSAFRSENLSNIIAYSDNYNGPYVVNITHSRPIISQKISHGLARVIHVLNPIKSYPVKKSRTYIKEYLALDSVLTQQFNTYSMKMYPGKTLNQLKECDRYFFDEQVKMNPTCIEANKIDSLRLSLVTSFRKLNYEKYDSLRKLKLQNAHQLSTNALIDVVKCNPRKYSDESFVRTCNKGKAVYYTGPIGLGSPREYILSPSNTVGKISIYKVMKTDDGLLINATKYNITVNGKFVPENIFGIPSIGWYEMRITQDGILEEVGKSDDWVYYE